MCVCVLCINQRKLHWCQSQALTHCRLCWVGVGPVQESVTCGSWASCGSFAPLQWLYKALTQNDRNELQFFLRYHCCMAVFFNLHVWMRPCSNTPDSNDQLVIRLQQSLITSWSSESGPQLKQGGELRETGWKYCPRVTFPFFDWEKCAVTWNSICVLKL